MATLSSLRTEVLDIIQDQSYAADYDERIKNFINAGIDEIAHRYRLPALEYSETVTTTDTASYVSLPINYHSGLCRCYSETTLNNIIIYPGLRWLLEQHEGTIDKAGEIDGVTAQGGNLYYQKRAIETLRLYYQRRPTYLANGSDVESNLPSFLARDLLVNYACKRYFERVEDGIDGQKVNTLYHSQQYEIALAHLEGHINQRLDPTWVKPSAWI